MFRVHRTYDDAQKNRERHSSLPVSYLSENYSALVESALQQSQAAQLSAFSQFAHLVLSQQHSVHSLAASAFLLQQVQDAAEANTTTAAMARITFFIALKIY